MIIPDTSLIILAGGKSTRFGTKKEFHLIDGSSPLTRILENLGQIFKKVVISVKTETHVQQVKKHIMKTLRNSNYIRIIQDQRDGMLDGPLLGLYSAISLIKTKYAFLIQGDSPFVLSSDVKLLHDKISETQSDWITFASQSGWISYLISLFKISKVKEVMAKLSSKHSLKFSSILRSLDSCDLIVIEENNRLSNWNSPKPNFDLSLIDQGDLDIRYHQTIFPNRFYLKFQGSHDVQHKKEILVKESAVWRDTHILSHIEREIEKIS